jgi:hypothetical protein
VKHIIGNISLNAGAILVLIVLSSSRISGQDTISSESKKNHSGKEAVSSEKKGFRMTSLTFGGNGVNITRVYNTVSILIGGRGSATFNERFTIGGGGWGMTKGVETGSNTEGVYNFVKMGYGGIDLGYLFYPGEKFNLGAKVLFAGGAVFKETVPESKDKKFKIFPVLEPTLYYQISLSKLFRFEMGASYRLIRGTKPGYISDRELSGFSCYVGFLVSAGNCR